MKPNVLVSVPTYDGQIQVGIVGAMLQATKGQFNFQSSRCSLLARGFNELWRRALDARRDGVTHFCMLHSDIVPMDPWWLDRMLEIQQEKRADVLSVVSPVKSAEGFTTTALDQQMSDSPQRYRVRRLTLKEIYRDFPSTFTKPNLLVNTGLMLVSFRNRWMEDLSFNVHDEMMDHHGKRLAYTEPEDWNFSRQVTSKGGSIFATRDVKIKHHGAAVYTNAFPWGTEENDSIDKEIST